MKNQSSEELFELIKGMTRSEKKSFHLYARRNMEKDELKVLSLYSVINGMQQYDEKKLAKKLEVVQVRQLPAMKRHLYNNILDSLRVVNKSSCIDLQLHQLMDHARILHDRGFTTPALKALKRVKTLALQYHQVSFAYQAVVLEKQIELVYGHCDTAKISRLNGELEVYAKQLSQIALFSNVAFELYSLYKRYGTKANTTIGKAAEQIFINLLEDVDATGFYPQLYLLQAKAYYYLLTKDQPSFFQATRDWVTLFDDHPSMCEGDPLQFQRGLAYLSEAAFQTGDSAALSFVVKKMPEAADPFYKHLVALNLQIYQSQPDEILLSDVYNLRKMKSVHQERMLLLFYKAALLCNRCGLYQRSIDFSHCAINLKSDVRLDIQYQARMLHIEAHQHLENDELAAYLLIAANRFFRSKLM